MFDIQTVLDATASIAGGAATGVHAGEWKGAGGIAGVKLAYSLLPDNNDLAEQGPTHISFWEGTTITGGGGDLTVYTHRIRMQLMVAIPSLLPIAYNTLTPFFKLYRDAFASHLTLNGTCNTSSLDSATGIVQSIYPDRIALELFLSAVQKDSPSLAA